MTPSGAVRRVARVARSASMIVVGAFLTGCYGFSGGGGLPKQLKTVAIEPFDNQTAVPELQREVFELLRAALRDRLNLREAAAALMSTTATTIAAISMKTTCLVGERSISMLPMCTGAHCGSAISLAR